MMIKPATPADADGIAAAVTAAFGQSDEAGLVERLVADGDDLVSLVAEDESGVVAGHILFSRLTIKAGKRSIAAAALAPVSVVPERQFQGIGGALIRAGLDACRDLGVEAVVVLGHPGYYPRFGFSAALARRLECPFPGAGDAFMALELKPGALDVTGARVHYAKAFGV